MRKLILAGGLSLLVLPGATAFAGEGSFQPQQVASPVTGVGGYPAIGQNFIYNQAEGGQQAAQPASSVHADMASPAVQAGAFVYNTGANG